MTDLERKIKDANDAYWIKNNPIMSDADYDKLMNQLRQEQPNSPLLSVVGGTVGKYHHTVPMLSLNKAYTSDEVWTWMKSTPENSIIAVEPKFDGLAGKIEQGKLVTRGNGIYGQDISHVIPIVNVIQRPYNETFPLEEWIKQCNESTPVLGEIVISLENFKMWFASGKLLQQDGTPYANPRNAVAGIVNRKDIDDLPDGLLSFCVYEPFSHAYKKDWKEVDIPFAIERVTKAFKDKFPIDGIVFTLPVQGDDYKSMGFTAHHPRGAIAYKFGNPSRQGIVAGVEWQQGREVLTPVLNLKQRLDFDDVMVAKATIHNYDFFQKANLNIGDTVMLERAGGVIPKFKEVVMKGPGAKLMAPAKCPCCGHEVKVVGKDLVCTNQDCFGKIVPRMVYAAKCLRIDGLGPKTCNMLYGLLHITKLWELIKWNFQERIALLPGFTNYSADLLYKNIRGAIGNVYDWEVYSAIGIPSIGPELWKKICVDPAFVWTQEGYGTGYIQCLGPVQREILSQGLRTYYQDYCEMVMAFKPIPSVVVSSKGKICCTGTASVPRHVLAKQIEEHGYEFTDKMSKDVKYLVTNDLERTSSKMTAARQWNIPVITYLQLNELFN